MHVAILPATTFRVTGLIERKEHGLADRGPFGQHGIDHVRRGFLEPRKRGQLRDVVHIVQQETDVVERGLVRGHERAGLEERVVAGSKRNTTGCDLNIGGDFPEQQD